MPVLRLLILLILAPWPSAMAQSSDDSESGNWSIHFQATSIGQHHGWFHSPYEGENSLPAHPESRVSITATVFLAYRLNRWTELVFDPELAGGKGFGQVTGIAGFTNGEIPRVAEATPQLYAARAYLRNSWGLCPETGMVESGENQVAGREPVCRFTMITGKFAITDFFDNNSYSHDPRRQFMNWALMSNGAWDYPADTRGYTIGTVQELAMRSWSLRAAAVMEPTEANGPAFDTRIAKNRGVAAEWEQRYKPFGHSGALRVLGFLNREHAGTFRDALLPDGTTDLASTRRSGTKKYGFGLNLEQEIARDIGAFGRYGWSDGKTETWAFTHIDRSISSGLSIQGRRWKRPKDAIGVAAVRNYLAGDDRAFLAAGGLGFIIGDGRLNYAPESITEAYYAWHASRRWTFTLDYQRVVNPAYNRDRGPVSVGSLRVHWER
ncbi:MAG TPA: carbohydrate porin [Verrucomicrobiae bacterium]|nr:carbohydrate porin [Verrucomicrobiae bacterium]